MARPRTPTKVLELRGAFAKNPNRAREDAQDAGALQDPPESLTPDAEEAWHQIVKAAPLSVITESDRFALEIAAILLADFRADPAGFPAAKLARLEALLGKFGMTPADRSKVGATRQQPKANPFGDL